MRIAIAGGHGTIALHLTRILADRGDQVASMIRDESQSDEIRSAGGEPVLTDLEAMDGSELAEAIGSADAVVFAAGAGPNSGPERKESVDYEAAVKMIDAAKELGASRYVIVSSMGANAHHEGSEVFDVYLRAKGRADDALRDSAVPHVIVRPGGLTDDSGTGTVELAESVEGGQIPRADVAAVIAETLRDDAPTGVTFEVVSGDTPIAAALAGLS